MKFNSSSSHRIHPIALKHGAAVGSVQIGLTLVAYILDTSLLFNPWFGLSTWTLMFVAMYLGLKGIRAEEGNVLNFRRAWGHAYVIVAVMTALVIGFTVMLYTVIDPGLVDLAVRASLDQIREVSSLMGGESSPQFEALMETMEPEIRKGLSVGGILMSGVWSLLFYAIPTLIMALIMRRRPAEERFV